LPTPKIIPKKQRKKGQLRTSDDKVEDDFHLKITTHICPMNL